MVRLGNALLAEQIFLDSFLFVFCGIVVSKIWEENIFLGFVDYCCSGFGRSGK